jgi:hypothetical protein
MTVVTERPRQQPPYEASAAITGVFLGGLGVAGLAARVRQAIGERVTCSRCGGAWAVAVLATTQILAPRFGRLLT